MTECALIRMRFLRKRRVENTRNCPLYSHLKVEDKASSDGAHLTLPQSGYIFAAHIGLTLVQCQRNKRRMPRTISVDHRWNKPSATRKRDIVTIRGLKTLTPLLSCPLVCIRSPTTPLVIIARFWVGNMDFKVRIRISRRGHPKVRTVFKPRLLFTLHIQIKIAQQGG